MFFINNAYTAKRTSVSLDSLWQNLTAIQQYYFRRLRYKIQGNRDCVDLALSSENNHVHLKFSLSKCGSATQIVVYEAGLQHVPNNDSLDTFFEAQLTIGCLFYSAVHYPHNISSLNLTPQRIEFLRAYLSRQVGDPSSSMNDVVNYLGCLPWKYPHKPVWKPSENNCNRLKYKLRTSGIAMDAYIAALTTKKYGN